MDADSPIPTLAFLLDFDGCMHRYEQGYFVKFEIKRIEPTGEGPHVLRYTFTLHAPEGERLMGFATTPIRSRRRATTRSARWKQTTSIMTNMTEAGLVRSRTRQPWSVTSSMRSNGF